MTAQTPTHALLTTARAMVANGKGLLAMDESTGTCNRRFAEAGIAQTEEMRRAWRELLLTAPGLGECINGVILVDETIRQSTQGGVRFVDLLRNAGILIGIKVDLGAKPLAACPGEKITEGLDGLRERLQTYAELGARFAKWRGVIGVAEATPASSGLPSLACIEANAHALARYAALCQEAGLVPIVEPEVLMDGNHNLARCGEVTERVLRAVFDQLAQQRVALEAMILKPNMIVPGLASASQHSDGEVAAATLQCLRRTVPAAVPGIAFLSGGQTAAEASGRLNAMHVPCGEAQSDARVRRSVNALHDGSSGGSSGSSSGSSSDEPVLPWPLSFSFGRALQQPALTVWAGIDAQRVPAQAALIHRARCNRAALLGSYLASMESP